MLSNEEQIKIVITYFTWIESIVKMNNDFAYTDINISIETFILKLLKIVDLGSYENCNIKRINYPNIDLLDSDNKIGIQITSETTAKKIRETLDANTNVKIKFFFLDSSYNPRKETFKAYSNFSVENDIINFKKTLIMLNGNESKISEVIDFLKSTIVLPVETEKFKSIINGYDKYQQETILRDINNVCERFVPTNITSKCLKHLEEKNLLILIGNPGVGKSYNSKFLVAKYLEKGYKLLYSPNKNLKDIFDKYNDAEKFILFIDDIFGSNNMDFMSTLSDSEIISLLENTNDNLKIIINSRTSIFKDVNQKYDKIGRLGLKPFIIETSDFSYTEKARILIKHLKLSNIPQKCIDSLFEKGDFYIPGITNKLNIYRIIYHKNYNPRIIDQMTRTGVISTDDNYIDNVLENLDNPKLVYDHSYNNNLNENERLIIKLIYLKSTYKNNNEVNIDELCILSSKLGISEEDFKIAIDKLEKSFISVYNSGNKVCKFYDPSVMDYCIYKFKSSSDMKRLIDFASESDELDNVLLNDKIDFATKKKRIIDLNYSNFKVLKEFEKEIINDDELSSYIKKRIFNENQEFSCYENYFCDEKFISEEEMLEKLSEMNKIEQYISFSSAGANNNLTKVMIKNFERFSQRKQEKIVDYSVKEIDDVIYFEIIDFIDSQYTRDDCDEYILKDIYEESKSHIIENLKNEKISVNLINEIEINLKQFDMQEFDDYIDDAFNDDDDENDIDNDTAETINIIEEFCQSKIKIGGIK